MARTSFGPARGGRAIGLVVLVALALRGAYAWAVTSGDGVVGDQIYYSAQAHMNAMGSWFTQPFTDGLPGADHPPLTVALLTPISFIFRHGEFVAAQRAFTVAVGAANVALLVLVARRFVGHRAALFAGGLAAVHAALWMGDATILSEPYAITALLLVLLAALRLSERRDLRSAAWLGAAGGVLALGRSELVLLTPLLLLLILFTRRRTGGDDEADASGPDDDGERTEPVTHRLRTGAVALVVLGLVLTPWVGWNLARFEERALLSTNDGFTLLGSNCPPAYYGPTTGSYQIGCALEPVIPAEYDASQASALRSEIAIEYARDHLGRLPVVAAARIARLWLIYDPGLEIEGGPSEGRPQWAVTIGIAQFWLLVPFAVIGARRVVGARRRILLAVPVVTTLAAVLVAAYWRIRVPADVVLLILAGAGIEVAVAWFTRRWSPAATPRIDTLPTAIPPP